MDYCPTASRLAMLAAVVLEEASGDAAPGQPAEDAGRTKGVAPTEDAASTNDAGSMSGAGSTQDAGSTKDAGSTSDAGPTRSCGAGLQAGAPWPMFGGCERVGGWSPAVGPASPTTLWFFPAAVSAQPAIAADGTVYVGTDDGKLYALRSDGSVKWTFAGEMGESLSGIGADGTLYVSAGNVGTTSGVYAIGAGH